MARELRVLVPNQVYERILKICKEIGATPQDLLMRAIVKVLEEFEMVGREGRR